MFGFFSRKKEAEQVREETKKSFESVKKDMSSIGIWIKHLDSEKNSNKKEIDELKNTLSSVKEEIENIKNIISIVGELKIKQISKQVFNKQTSVYPVQTAVQTAVQTPNLDYFSNSEKAIVWILLNSEMNLSYDDLAVILNKQKSTIRGQINSIKQKAEVIEEKIEKNGRKRVFIPEKIKEILLKKQKVSIKGKLKNKKN
ncbi:hypothetical protein AUJ83_00830 [Candidatus Woesearchaeota archaeon CG1_02_33_12]|nr:MAG: hypothetical protein AUJ83_00830 [Candidatus Woesearchaeota archaeon CG1_02_33_12]